MNCILRYLYKSLLYITKCKKFAKNFCKFAIFYLNFCKFASKLCKNLIQKLTEAYPDLKFNLITNGILATKENIELYGLKNKILSIEVSMHAVTKETYDKIVRGGDFNAVMKNLKNILFML